MTPPDGILQPGKLPVELLGRMLRKYAVHDDRVLIGPGTGRDSAALRFGDSALVVKTDPITFPTDRPAHHLIHVNANDIACQGAVPRWLLVTALLPHGSTTAETVATLFADLTAESEKIGVKVIGGHTEITIGLDRPILVGTMLGETSLDGLIDPALAKPGDRLLMTRTAGIEGTVLLANAMRTQLLTDYAVPAASIDVAATYLQDPGISVLKEARALADASIVSAMHDPTEGGVATAIRELAIAANCGVLVSRDAIGLTDETRVISEALGIDPLGLLASGSLLAAVPKERLDSAANVLDGIGVPFAWIGKLTPPDAGMRLRSGASEMDLPEFAVDEVARILAG
jgi:hydrogenase expression/formation protein HypE